MLNFSLLVWLLRKIQTPPKNRKQHLHSALWQQWPPYILARIRSTTSCIIYYILQISTEKCFEMGPQVTADSGRFCRLIYIELSCVFSSTLAINFHDNKSYIWRISMTWHHKYLADIQQFLPHTDAYAIVVVVFMWVTWMRRARSAST